MPSGKVRSAPGRYHLACCAGRAKIDIAVAIHSGDTAAIGREHWQPRIRCDGFARDANGLVGLRDDICRTTRASARKFFAVEQTVAVRIPPGVAT